MLRPMLGSMTYSLTFHGAAGTVTGSCIAIRHEDEIVLVDCGLFQGTKSVRALNYTPFPFNPSEVTAVLLTHAHIDHCGLLPKLVAEGVRPPIYCTDATADLLGFMLPDTAHIQEYEVARLNNRNRRRGRPEVTPIYTRTDADEVLTDIRVVELGEIVEVRPWLAARFWDAGHILGSASIEVVVGEDALHGLEPDETEEGGFDGERVRSMRLLFSGDLGPDEKAFHTGPKGPQGVDYLIVESTYGGRHREPMDAETRRALLGREINAALKRGGPILMPVFAVERTQEILYDLDILLDDGIIPNTRIFLDSPLAIRATEAFDKHLDDINEEGTPHPFRRGNLHPLMNAEESKKLEHMRGAAIIMAGSGMCDAGRIREHLADHLWRAETTVLIVGYQAPGTIGRLLVEGHDHIRIHGQDVEVRATIRDLDYFSGHADHDELVEWVAARGPVRRSIFISHGEDDARLALADALVDRLELDPADILRPGLDERFDLKRSGRPKRRPPKALRLAADAMATPDWHNRYAEIALKLSRRLGEASDDATRTRMLEKIEAILDGEGKRDR